jgi:hypothetical protein
MGLSLCLAVRLLLPVTVEPLRRFYEIQQRGYDIKCDQDAIF